jgi:hypothetical protein
MAEWRARGFSNLNYGIQCQGNVKPTKSTLDEKFVTRKIVEDISSSNSKVRDNFQIKTMTASCNEKESTSKGFYIKC